jgi:hypothetical protein
MPDRSTSLQPECVSSAARGASPAARGFSPAEQVPGPAERDAGPAIQDVSPDVRGTSPAMRGFLDLVKKIDKDAPAPADVQAARDMLREHPDLWRLAGDLSRAAALDIINQLGAGPAVTESLKRGQDVLMDELGYDAVAPLERLLIEQVALCWLSLNLVQIEYTHAIGEPISISAADHWERRLSAAQGRYIRACDALARIRKLTRTTPPHHVNIAPVSHFLRKKCNLAPAEEPANLHSTYVRI